MVVCAGKVCVVGFGWVMELIGDDGAGDDNSLASCVCSCTTEFVGRLVLFGSFGRS